MSLKLYPIQNDIMNAKKIGESLMSAYLITEIEVLDPTGYETYRSAVGATLAQFGGEFLVRGGNIEILEGVWHPKRIVMCKFESLQTAKDWYHSEEYQQVKKLRESTAKMNIVAVDGA